MNKKIVPVKYRIWIWIHHQMKFLQLKNIQGFILKNVFLLNENLQRWLFISTSQPRNIKCNSVFPFKRWNEYANQMRKMKSLGLYCLLDDDFGKWPMWLSDTMRMFLAKHILMQIIIRTFWKFKQQKDW